MREKINFQQLILRGPLAQASKTRVASVSTESPFNRKIKCKGVSDNPTLFIRNGMLIDTSCFFAQLIGFVLNSSEKGPFDRVRGFP